jgi:phage I-like protein
MIFNNILIGNDFFSMVMMMSSYSARSDRRISRVAATSRCAKAKGQILGGKSMDGGRNAVFHSSALKSASDYAVKQRGVIRKALDSGKLTTTSDGHSGAFRKDQSQGRDTKIEKAGNSK